MRKLLYTLLAVAAAVGCTKDAEVDTPNSSGEAVSFTITDDLTRATKKVSWDGGEEIAIFVGDATTAKRYKLSNASALTLEPYDEANAIEVSAAAVTYTAYYPYMESLSDYTDFKASDTDLLKASVDVAENSYSAKFSIFDHMLSYVTVNYTGMTSLSITRLDGDSTVTLFDFSSIIDSYSFFASEVSATDLANCRIVVTTSSGDTYLASAVTDEITKWEAGEQYNYALSIADWDIYYNTTDKVCEIYTAKGLVAFSNIVYGRTVDESDVVIDGATVSEIINDATDKTLINGKLMANIDISGETSWNPIGYIVYNYRGVFDGNGFEVELNIDNSTSSYQGLFGWISKAEIKNVGVTGSVTASGCSAGVVGYAENGSKIYNCYNRATILGDSSCVGGVVGRINDANSTISYCYNTGAVETSSNFIGGVVGSSQSPISYCYNTGDVKNSNTDIGGIVGVIISVDVTCCYNLGDVTSTGRRVGGVVGLCTSSTILNCYNVGDVIGDGYSVGGVVGQCSGANNKICNSYNSGSVTSKLESGSYFYTGGIVGCPEYNSAPLAIINCYNAGMVSNATDASQCGSLAGISTSTYITATDCYYLIDSATTTTTSGTTSGTVTFTSGTTEKSAADMKLSSFVDDLNSVASGITGAMKWQYNYNTYPILTTETASVE